MMLKPSAFRPKERLRILEVLGGEDLNLKVGFYYAGPTCNEVFSTMLQKDLGKILHQSL